MMDAAMTRDHPRWNEFGDLLALRAHECRHDLQHTLAVLAEMDNAIDVPATLAYLKKRGGYCDCEVMLNVVCAE